MFNAYIGEGHAREITVPITEVHQPLMSIKKCCPAGQYVVFDENGSFMMDKNKGGGDSHP